MGFEFAFTGLFLRLFFFVRRAEMCHPVSLKLALKPKQAGMKPPWLRRTQTVTILSCCVPAGSGSGVTCAPSPSCLLLSSFLRSASSLHSSEETAALALVRLQTAVIVLRGERGPPPRRDGRAATGLISEG